VVSYAIFYVVEKKRKGGENMTKAAITRLRKEYPNHVPLKVAGELLNVSERRLSRLIAEGRKPFSDIGANIGIEQKYVRIYTERLIAYLNSETLPE
jgi:DNA-binding CsgD family transcriptional regulator